MENILRVLDGMSTPTWIVCLVILFVLGVYYVIRHESEHKMGTDNFAFQYKMSKNIIRAALVIIFVGLVAYGLDGISKPFEHVVYKDRVVIKFPNIQQEFKECMDHVNLAARDYEDYNKRCKSYVQDLANAGTVNVAPVTPH